jgi:hypothetical protein
MPCKSRDRLLTVALSTHRPETLPAAAALMDGHDIICLEEPKTPNFEAMLAGDISIDDYLPETDTEYPAFTRRSCRLLRHQHRQGKTIHQIEPYLDTLLDIQLRLADGQPPAAMASQKRFSAVYAVEKTATGALLEFYRGAASGDFDDAVAAALQFVEADARRFRLRDRLRAEALARLLPVGRRIYVEAGTMHLSLIPRLAALRGRDQRIRVVHLQAADARRLGGRAVLLAPGDRLTFWKIFNRRLKTAAARLLAAQSLVYNRIISTSELAAADGDTPHLADEHACIALVSALDMAACRALYPHVKRLSTENAREMVTAFVKRFGLNHRKRNPSGG